MVPLPRHAVSRQRWTHHPLVQTSSPISTIASAPRTPSARASARYREIIDSMPGLVAVVESCTVQTEFVNQRVLGLLRHESRRTCSVWQRTQTPSIQTICRESPPRGQHAIATGEPSRASIAFADTTASIAGFSLRAVPERDRDGHIIRWPVLITDVDDRRRAEDASASQRSVPARSPEAQPNWRLPLRRRHRQGREFP